MIGVLIPIAVIGVIVSLIGRLARKKTIAAGGLAVFVIALMIAFCLNL